ncbi:MAG: leucine-rich repeat domain-containing protein [Paludibacter sp.]
MKTNYILVGAFIALACFLSPLKAQVLIDGIAYDTITIRGTKVAQTVSLPKQGDTDVRYSQATIVIPASVELYGTTYPVKKIGNNSMRNNNNLISITLPEGLEIIGNSSLAQCEALPSIVLPSTVNSIEDWAFYGDFALASINIPNGVTTMTEHTYQQCKSLTSIQLPPSVTSIKVCAFQDCAKLASINLENITEIVAWSLYGTALSSANISNVLSIGDCAFAKIPTLTNVELNNVGEIGDWCFQDCANLTSVNLNGTELIQSGAFSGCTLLTSITLPTSVAFIANWSFEKTGITKIYASWNDPLADVIIEENAFGTGDGKINFSWYVPESVFYNWADFFMGYLVNLTDVNAVENQKIGNYNVSYNSGILNITNLDGYQTSIMTVDGRSISNFVVDGNDYKTGLKLNNGIYILNATNGNGRAVAKFIVK